MVCGLPPSENIQNIPAGDQIYRHGDVITIPCQQGYQVSDGSHEFTAQCQTNGLWTHPDIVDCFGKRQRQCWWAPIFVFGGQKISSLPYLAIDPHFKAGPPWGYFSHLWSQSLNFLLFESSWKKWKMTPLLCACAVVITLETQNVENGHFIPSNLTFLLIAIDRNGFCRMKEEGLIYKNLPQIF